MGRRTRPSGITGSTLTSAPPTVPIGSVAHNPRNPRGDYDDVEELAASIREMGILQPLGVVRYEVFLSHYPQHEHDIGTHEWVVINGNRRLAAARLAGLEELPVRGLDHLGRDNMLDEAALVENIHRQELAPLREAAAILLLVDRHGSQAAAARRLGKSNAFVSYRLSLLRLVPHLQDALSRGELSVEEARELARVPPGEQLVAWRRSAGVHGVNTEHAVPPEAGVHAVNAAPVQPADVHGVNAAAAPKTRRTRRPSIHLDGTPADVAAGLRKHLSPQVLAELARLII